MDNTQRIDEERSQRSLFTDNSQSSDYAGTRKKSNTKEQFQQPNKTINTLKSVEKQQPVSKNTRFAIRAMNARPPPRPLTNMKPPRPPKQQARYSISTSKQLTKPANPSKQVVANYGKTSKPSNRYSQPRGIVNRVKSRSYNKSFNQATSEYEIQQLKRKELMRITQSNPKEDKAVPPMLTPLKTVRIVLQRPVLPEQILIKSKLQRSYLSLLAAYDQAYKRLIGPEFKIGLDDKLQRISKCCEEYLGRKIRQGRIQENITEASEESVKSYFKDYQPGWKEFSLQKLTDQDSVMFKKYKSGVYFGQFKQGKKEGYGVMIYNDDRRFEGLFDNDLRTYGMQQDGDSYYIGKFFQGAKQGQGCFYKTPSATFYGKFVADQWVGQGFRLQAEEIVCTDNNCISVVKSINQHIYVGKYKNKCKEQIGLQRFPDGDLYLGSYQDNKSEGYGQYFWANGAVYQGDFMFGMRHGKGYWYIEGGDQFVGDYSNDKKCGQGEYVWKNGTVYKGMFENDFRHGYGQMLWADGKSFKGDWLNGLQANKKLRFLNANKSQQLSDINKKGLPLVNTRYQTITPSLNKPRNSIDPKRVSNTIDVRGNARHQQLSQRLIHKDRIRALFNPNFNLDY